MREGETVFLRHLLLACGTSESRLMDEKLRQAQDHEACVRRGMWWVTQLILLALAGLAYTAVLLQGNIPERAFDFLVRLFSRIGLGSSISLGIFFYLWLLHHRQLCRRRKECRYFITRIVHSCVERSSAAILPLRLDKILEYPAKEGEPSRSDRSQAG